MLVLGQEEEAVGPGSALARLHTNKDFSLIWIFTCFICLALDPGRNILARWSAGKFLTGGTVPSLGIVALVLTEDVGDLTMGPSYVLSPQAPGYWQNTAMVTSPCRIVPIAPSDFIPTDGALPNLPPILLDP